MMAMGLVVNPATDKVEVRLDHARHLVDLIQMLQEKTEGNRTSDETALMENMLHQLRMAFVSVEQQAAAGGQ